MAHSTRAYSTASGETPGGTRSAATRSTASRSTATVKNIKSRFNKRTLGEDEKKFLFNKAHECADILIHNIAQARQNRGPIKWTEIDSGNEGIKMLQGVPKARMQTNGTELHGLVTFRIQASLKEAASFFDMSTSHKMEECLRYFKDLAMGEVIHLIDNQPETNGQVNVMWGLTQLPVITDRDFVVLECQRSYQDAATGRPAWVRAYNSIKLPECPEFGKYVRSRLYHTGYVLVESAKEGYLDCTYMLHINMKGKLRVPSFANKLILKRRLKGTAELGLHMHLKSMNKMYQEHDTSTEQLKLKGMPQSVCDVCFDEINERNGPTPSTCKKCKKDMCKNCTSWRQIEVPGFGMTTLELCHICIAEMDRSDVPESTRSAGTSAMEADDGYEPIAPQAVPKSQVQYWNGARMQGFDPFQHNPQQHQLYPQQHYGYGNAQQMYYEDRMLPGQDNGLHRQNNTMAAQQNGMPRKQNGMHAQQNGMHGHQNVMHGQQNGILDYQHGMNGHRNGMARQQNATFSHQNGVTGQQNGRVGRQDHQNVMRGQQNVLPEWNVHSDYMNNQGYGYNQQQFNAQINAMSDPRMQNNHPHYNFHSSNHETMTEIMQQKQLVDQMMRQFNNMDVAPRTPEKISSQPQFVRNQNNNQTPTQERKRNQPVPLSASALKQHTEQYEAKHSRPAQVPVNDWRSHNMPSGLRNEPEFRHDHDVRERNHDMRGANVHMQQNRLRVQDRIDKLPAEDRRRDGTDFPALQRGRYMPPSQNRPIPTTVHEGRERSKSRSSPNTSNDGIADKYRSPIKRGGSTTLSHPKLVSSGSDTISTSSDSYQAPGFTQADFDGFVDATLPEPGRYTNISFASDDLHDNADMYDHR